MSIIPNGIPVRLIAVFGDAELPDGSVEVGTLQLPVTVTESDASTAETGEFFVQVTPDVSVFDRLADFFADEGRDPKQKALDDENARLDVERAQLHRAQVYGDPGTIHRERQSADERFARAQMRSGRRF